jgi:alpha-D-xyloside xylohydrolase
MEQLFYGQMFYDFNSDIESYQSENQYRFGPDYLVAPVYGYGATSLSVYLPAIYEKNLMWQHYYAKQTYEGRLRYDIATTLDDFPLLSRSRLKILEHEHIE